MRISATTDAPADTAADTVAIGVFEGKSIAHDAEDGTLQALVDSGEAKAKPGHLALAHASGKRWLLVGLGDRDALDAEGARTAAGRVAARCGELGTRTLCWEVPHKVGEEVVEALVEGTVLAGYRFDRYKSTAPSSPTDEESAEAGLEALIVSDHGDVSEPVRRAEIVAHAVCAMRDLQNTPANDMTPAALAGRAQALADEHAALSCEIERGEQIRGRGMGAFAAVARGSDEDPALIVLRYEPAGAEGPVLGFVGKAVTFDSGGISIKPAANMGNMKFDMSGGAAVIEAVGAIAALGLAVRVVGVVGATENMVSGRSMRPGDIVTAMNGVTIEIDNTDAEGRLVLADCLSHAVALGAERLVDIATLTGGIVTTFGSVHAGVFADDDAWCEAVTAAGARTGERVWRLPLDPDYAKLIESQTADIVNSGKTRKATSIAAAQFLARFTGGVPWAHLDIAGVGWDLGKPYAPKGGSGFGLRLLVALAAAA